MKYQRFRGEPGGDTCVPVGQTGPLSSLAPHCLSAWNISRDHQWGTVSVFGLVYCGSPMCFFISFDAESLFGLSRCVGKNSKRGIMMDEIICGEKKMHKPLSIRVCFISGNHLTICSVKVNYDGHELGARIPAN